MDMYCYQYGTRICTAKKILTQLGYSEPYKDTIQLPECCEIAIRTKEKK